MTNDEVYGAFLGDGKTFFHGHTYTGNPLGAAVALANLELTESSDLLAKLPAKIALMAQSLERMATLPAVGDVRQRGMIAGIELVADRATKARFPAEAQVGAKVCRRARERGALLRPLGDIIVLMPPLAIDAPMLAELCAIVESSIAEVDIAAS